MLNGYLIYNKTSYKHLISTKLKLKKITFSMSLSFHKHRCMFQFSFIKDEKLLSIISHDFSKIYFIFTKLIDSIGLEFHESFYISISTSLF